MLNVTKDNNQISVESPYNQAWVARARELGGKWDAGNRVWVFDESKEQFVRDALMEIYGENGLPTEMVTVDIDIDNFKYEQQITLAGVIVATRFSRDSRVKLNGDAFVAKGGFESSGGSTKYPKVTAEEGTIIRVSIPVAIYEKVKEKAGVKKVDTQSDKKDALEKEREALLKRLAEIDAELAAL